MKIVGLNSDSFVFSFPYDPRIIIDLKQIESAAFQKRSKAWAVPCSTLTCDRVEEIIVRHDFVQSPLVEDRLADLKVDKYILETLATATHDDLIISGLKIPLRPYQLAAVRYMATSMRCLNASDRGVGKTFEALAAIHYMNAYPALVVCPSVVKYKWQKESNVLLPDEIDSTVITPKEFDTSDISIINYDLLKKYEDKLTGISFQSIVLDEMHRVKDKKTQRSKVVHGISHNIPVIIGLTGTPVVNHPSDLINQLAILRRLDEFGGFFGFASRYCGMRRTEFGLDISGATNQEEMFSRLKQSCLTMVLKEDVLHELPPKSIETILVPISTRSDYQAVVKHSRLMQATIPKESASANAWALQQITKLRQIAAEGKLDHIKDWVDDFVERNKKVVLFGHHKKILSQIASWHPNISVTITGDDSAEEKDRKATKFQMDPEILVAVCSIDAAGEGISLNSASYMGFAELPWTDAKFQQAVDREHRYGQANPVTAYVFLGASTIDHYMWNIIQTKQKLSVSYLKMLSEITSQ